MARDTTVQFDAEAVRRAIEAKAEIAPSGRMTKLEQVGELYDSIIKMQRNRYTLAEIASYLTELGVGRGMSSRDGKEGITAGTLRQYLAQIAVRRGEKKDGGKAKRAGKPKSNPAETKVGTETVAPPATESKALSAKPGMGGAFGRDKL